VTARTLVGRDHELDALDEAMKAALAGDRALLMVTGDPGIGKTRLLEELAGRMIAQGGIVAWGRMWEVGVTPPFLPWVQLLAALETRADRAPALGSLEAHSQATARFSRFGEVAEFLARRAAAAPVGLLFDDLHVADPSSLELLEYVLPELLGKRVLIALAARSTDAGREVLTALARLQRGARRLALGPLGRGAVGKLVGDQADAQKVFELSEGNPLFVEELLSSQRASGVLSLPRLSSVREVIFGRTARLPEGTRAVLRAGSVLGRDFRARIAGEMLAQSDAAAALKPALSLGMLNMVGPDRYRFSHALVAETLADELEPGEREELHARAAEALARHDAGALTAIAHHLLSAGALRAQEACLAAERGAARCSAQLAFEDAAALLERAIDVSASTLPRESWLRVRLCCARAEALQHAGKHEAATRACDQATELLGRVTESSPVELRELFARVALARGLEFRFGRTDPRLVATLREALSVIGEVSVAVRAKLLARLAAAEQPSGTPEEPVRRAYEAIELSKQLSTRDRLDVMYVATAALVDYVEPAAISAVEREVLELARGVDPWIVTHTLFRLCFPVLEGLDRRGFDLAVQTFAAEARALGLPRWTRHIHMLTAVAALLEGRFADAEREAMAFESTSESIGDASAQWLLDVHRCMVDWTRTSPVNAERKVKLAGYAPGRAPIAAWFAVQQADHVAARSALGELAGRLPSDPDLGAMVAGAVAFVDDAQQAAAVYAALSPRSGRIVLASMVGSAVLDLYDRLLLLLAATLERWPEVESHARTALEVAKKLGSPVWEARVAADLADALVRRGAAEDAARIQALRREALATAERLEMPGLAARCRERLASRGSSGVPSTPLSSTLALQLAFHKQGELWLITGFGESIHVKDSRGLQMIARLVAEPGRPLHVLELSGSSGEVDGGDAGPALDARARDAYRQRLTTLLTARDEAEARGDAGHAARAEHEIDALTAELERAFGLGGRERRVGAASERARSNVQRRIAHGLEQIRAASTRLGEHLAASLKTGTCCVYAPLPKG
jgi:hypothetical protein